MTKVRKKDKDQGYHTDYEKGGDGARNVSEIFFFSFFFCTVLIFQFFFSLFFFALIFFFDSETHQE